MNKETTIKSVEFVRDGLTNGKAWSMFTVTDADNVRYTSFQKEPWATLAANGQKTVISYEEKPGKINPKTNKPYMNKTIVEPKKEKSASGTNPEVLERILSKVERIDRIEKMVEKIGIMVAQLAPAEEGPQESNDVPF